MRKFLLAIFAFATMSMFASDLQLWQNSTLNKILQRGELRVGMDPGYMPFEMKDKKVILLDMTLIWLEKWLKN